MSKFVTCVLALTLSFGLAPGCKSADNRSPSAKAVRSTKVRCPQGTPRMEVKDGHTFVFECPGGAQPIREEVAAAN
jgi:hypothetical protein